MNYRALILTGTSGSGKSTLSRLLQGEVSSFEHVTAITTRSPRPDDEPGSYDYLSPEQFELARESLIIWAEYRGKHYGITRNHLSETELRGSTPVMVITPRSLAEFLERQEPGQAARFLTVFVDAPDEVLDLRLGLRGAPDRAAEILQQRSEDRSHCSLCHYVLQNIDLSASLAQLVRWWTP